VDARSSVRQTTRVLLASLLLWAAAACGGGKLQRTDLSRWKAKTFEEPGIVAKFPVNAEVHTSPSNVLIQMHGVPPPFGVFDDTRYHLEVSVWRESEEEFERRRDELHRYVPRTPEKEGRFWRAQRHEMISERYDPPYSYYRYDVACGGGEMLSARVEMFNVIENGQPIYRAADDAAVRRILSSIRCLPSQGRSGEKAGSE
jgi:hypothetical protein